MSDRSTLQWGQRTYLMGVINVTPDSFSDGGQFLDPAIAVAQGQALWQAGADILDIGGQSTRPGAETVPLAVELARVIPVVRSLRAELGSKPILSVDTTRVEVAAAALAAGADWINDISGGTFEPEILSLAAERQAPIVLMHLRGTPQTMQQLTDYDDVVTAVQTSLVERREAAIAAGVQPERIILDPGIGFAKTAEQNLELLRRQRELTTLGCPLLVGVSRKSFIGKILNQPDPQQRVWGTAAACSAAIAQGADILRVHDVAAMVDVARVADAIWRSP
ncbi:dihydropteroate synthase [Synechococcus elongatus]|uniref:Dihydropteroate synthase n=2 Tax=Synechococcus elongatus TaxID=32046 RepID=Q31KT6_SYNE7|nr:dihydropteroate synthase [Synechococcus elongatus]ABB58333.1 Dihydropteroate synthase [Synechococcus elongatus PCC 7942 = FACHB-805]AJD57202.1 dihydropteroate synthase [Synechococcus elongatus UTEX 2973]MBD2587056.1 dihydropteroate synthase [Synechococcus elongatus FACHB-242]MBD2688127.1 dihydropteroate synthase [Synechococcus elongatus FACHB-1061]MBD2706162.1 dihydropteroate synthase [Synechococcus elongatus PCC 7942 = FACHB-805]